MSELDIPERFAELDPNRMIDRIAELPQQCEDSWKIAQRLELPEHYRQVDKVLILGLGGSGIGADLLRTLVANESRVPVIAHRDYMLPAYVDARTLVIASSYSGGTEETLMGFDQAVERGACVVSVTTGGKLAAKTREQGLPLYTYDYPAQPRAVVGYSLIALLGIMQRLSLVEDKAADITEANSVMRAWQREISPDVPLSQNAAKILASKLYRKVPVVYGGEHLSEVARRWKGQFNENSKSWSFFDTLPELNHNSVVGFPNPPDLPADVHVILLSGAGNHPRVLLRVDITRQLLVDHGFSTDVVQARGESLLAQTLSSVHFGDYVSYYLAMLNHADPWAVGNIDFVKARLSQVGV